MALTRPKIGQIYTNITALTDAITVLNAGASQANVDVGLLINRAHGLLPNAAFYYSETLDTFVTAFTNNSGGTDTNVVVTSYADITSGNVYTTGLYWTGNGQPIVFSGGGGSGTYSNVNVAAYLLGNITTGNVSAAGFYFSNGTPFVSSVYGNANVASYLDSYFIYANANAASQQTSIDTLNANVTAVNVAISGLQSNAAFQANLLDILTGNASTQGSLLDQLVSNAAAQADNLTYLLSNAATQEASLTSLLGNAATQGTAIDSINSNIGAYQTWANANAASQQTSIDTLQTQVYSNVNAAAYLAGNIVVGNIRSTGYYFANGVPFASSNYSNVDVAAYLPTSTVITSINANIAAANAAIITANTDMKSYVDAQVVSAGGYGNTQVAQYLPTYTGDLNPGNVVASGNIVGGGVRNTSSSTPPANPVVGDTWYDTDNDVLLRYIDDGDSAQWVDITGVMVGTIGGGYKYTVSATPPANPIVGDNWYDTSTDILFRYFSDGTSYYWVDNSSIGIELPSGGSTAGNLSVTGKLFVSDDIIPTVSNTINIGSSTSRFGSLFLSGNTIYLGSTVITENTQLGTITFIPPATVSNPNPTAVIFTSNGGISAVETTAGSVTANVVTPNFANLTATSVYSSSYFYANGTAFVGGGGGLDNLDGGTPYSVYGGLTAIDGGGVV